MAYGVYKIKMLDSAGLYRGFKSEYLAIISYIAGRYIRDTSYSALLPALRIKNEREDEDEETKYARDKKEKDDIVDVRCWMQQQQDEKMLDTEKDAAGCKEERGMQQQKWRCLRMQNKALDSKRSLINSAPY